MKSLVNALRGVRNHVAPLVTPNGRVRSSAMTFVVFFWLVTFVFLWSHSPWRAIPRPLETLRAIGPLWQHEGLAFEIFTSLKLNLQAIAIGTVGTLLIAYLGCIPLFRPLFMALGYARFLGMVGLPFLFTVILGGGFKLKLSLQVMAYSFFFAKSVLAVIDSIPAERYDDARTIRLGPVGTLWRVVIRGTRDQMIGALRDNAAISWMMLPMIEGISRSAGGVGAMLLAENKHFRLEAVFAIQLIILAIGFASDAFIGWVHRMACPYAFLKLERR